MGFIKGETKYENFSLIFKTGDQRDYERAVAKLLLIWERCGYFPDASQEKPYVPESDKDIMAMSKGNINALPEPFKSKAEKVHRNYNEQVDNLKEMAKNHDIVKLLTSQASPEEGLVAVEKRFGLGSRGRSLVVDIAETYQDHEYQEWYVENHGGPVGTDTWSY